MYAVHPMTREAALDMATWRYAPPYDRYDPGADEGMVEFVLDTKNRYFAVRDAEGQLAGYCCFGADATVPGGGYSDATALDIGVGMRPALTGQGRGHAFIGAVIDFAVAQYAPGKLRVTIAAFNHRSQRVFERQGFTPTRRFWSETEPRREFVILERTA